MYLTRHDTELVKTVIARAWEIYCAVTVVLCFIFPTTIWFSSLFVVLAWGVYRLCRRYPRRHSECAAKGILHGWFFRRQYYRTTPKVPPLEDIRGCDALLRIERRRADNRDECRFECYCLECGDPFEVKPPELKSFSHRPNVFVHW